jgi:hypothetical protein
MGSRLTILISRYVVASKYFDISAEALEFKS